MNDLEKNIDVPLNEKTSFAKVTDDCNSIVITFSKDGKVKKEFLFGNPTDKKHNKYSDFHQSFFDEDTNTLICIFYEGNGYKNRKIAWVKFE